MICERCGQREATEHVSRTTEMSITVAKLCRACFIDVSGPVDLDEAQYFLKVEAELGTAVDWTPLAREWLERAVVHEQELPPKIVEFLRRWDPESSS